MRTEEMFAQILGELQAIRQSLNSPTNPPVAEFLDCQQAEAFAKCSARTLQRRHEEGHEVGLRKHGRRIVFHAPTLAAFLAAQASH